MAKHFADTPNVIIGQAPKRSKVALQSVDERDERRKCFPIAFNSRESFMRESECESAFVTRPQWGAHLAKGSIQTTYGISTCKKRGFAEADAVNRANRAL